MKRQTKTVELACIMTSAVETNCPKGGDSGHGGRTAIEFQDEGSTDLSVCVCDCHGNCYEVNEVKSVTIKLGGDHEAYALRDLLKWASVTLEKMLMQNAKESGHDAVESEQTQ
jgi:hypothetical protein